VKLDKHVFTATGAVTEVAEELGVKLKVQVPRLFGLDGSAEGSGNMRTITIENPLMSSLLFSVATEGPFQLRATADGPGRSHMHIHAPHCESALITSNHFTFSCKYEQEGNLRGREQKRFVGIKLDFCKIEGVLSREDIQSSVSGESFLCAVLRTQERPPQVSFQV
jgi:hypothetical protein